MAKAIAPMVGRSEELQRIPALLATSPIVTLIGPGGVGKTRIAREIVERTKGAFFLSLEGARTRNDVLGRIGAALAPREVGSTWAEVAAAFRASGASLVVLDNLEPVLDEGRALAEALAALGLSVLGTSRSALEVALEARLMVGPLPLDQALSLVRGVASRRGIELGPDSELQALVDVVDRLPLALELAAARLVLLTPKELVGRLRSGQDLLRPTALDPHARSMESAIRGSWDLLDEDARHMLVQLTLFRGGAPPIAAEAIAAGIADPLAAIERLTQASLVSVDGSETRRMRIHETVRSFAERQLDPTTATATALRFVAWWSRQCAERSTSELVEERENLFAAWELSTGAERVAISRALFLLVRSVGPVADVHRVLDGWRGAVSENGDIADVEVQRAGVFRTELRYPDAEEALAVAVDHARDDPALRARVLYQQGALLRELGRKGEALEKLLACESLALATGNDPVLVRSLIQRASMLMCGGPRAEIDALLTAATERTKPGGLDRALVVRCQAYAAGDRGDAVARRLLFTDARDLLTAEGDLRIVAIVGCELAEACLDLEEYDAALAHLVESERLHSSVGATVDLGTVAWVRGRVALDRGLLVEAAREFERVQDTWRHVGRVDLGSMTTPRVLTAMLLLAEGRAEEANAAAVLARTEVSDSRVHALASVIEAMSWLFLGDRDRAREARDRADPTSWDQFHRDEVWRLVDAALAGSGVAEAIATLKQPGPNGRPLWSSSADLRYWGRVVERIGALARRSVLVVGPEGAWAALDGGDRIDLVRFPTLRRVLWSLVEAHRATPELSVPTFALAEAAWPGEKVQPEAAQNRVYTSISKLRRLGLDRVLERTADGYRVVKGIDVRLAEG